ncbi:MAG: hypothetical protein WA030_03110 [Candidatus Microsaccharimonas sp.]
MSSVLSTGIASFVPSGTASAQALPGTGTGDTKTTCVLRVGYIWDDTAKTCTQAPSVSESYNLVKRVQSYAYLNALRRCIKNTPQADGSGNAISDTNARSGNWFGATSGAAASYLANNVEPVLGLVSCNSVVSAATTLWGYTNPLAMLCDFVDKRGDDSGCSSGTTDFGDFNKDKNDEQNADAFYSAIKTKVYKGNTPSLQETLTGGSKGYPGRYLLYKQAFLNGCEAKANSVSGAEAIYDNVPIVADDGTYTTDSYSGVGTDQTRPVYVGRDNLEPVIASCQTMVDEMNNYYLDYSAYRGDHPTEDAAMPAAGVKRVNCQINVADPFGTIDCLTGAEECSIEGVIGWLLCPAFKWLSSISDAIFSLMADTLLKVDPKLLSQTQPDPRDPTKTTQGAVYATWSVMRNLANIAFVIVFLIIIFSQMTSAGISNYGVKKMLPRLVVAALLVNLSFFICQIGVDLSNVLGYSLKGVLESTGQTITTTTEAVNPDAPGVDFSGMLLDIFAISSLASGGSIFLMQSALVLYLIVMIAALVSIIMTVLMLIGRLPLIIILTVLSPLAFVAFMLPNTKNVFTQWAKLYFALLAMFPLISIVYGLGSLTADIITATFSISDIQAVDDVLVPIIGMAVRLLPLFFVPFALKKLMGGMGAVGVAMAALSNKASSAGKSVRGAAKAGTKALARRGFNEGLGRMANSRFGNTKNGRRIGGLLSGKGKRGFSAMGAAHENETNKNIIDGWKRNNTYHNDGALEHIASSRPNTAEGRAAMAALAEKGSAEHLARVNKRIQRSGDQHAINAYNRAIDPHYSALKSKHPGAVKIMSESDYAGMKSAETHGFKDDAVGEGIATSTDFANMIRTAAKDPLQKQHYSQATIAWANGQGPIPGNASSIHPGPTSPPAGGAPVIPGGGGGGPANVPGGAPAPAPAPTPTAGGGRRASAPQGPPPTGGGSPPAAPTPPASTWTQVIQGATQAPAGTPPTTTTTTTNSNGGRRVTTSGPVDASGTTIPAPEATDLSISHDNETPISAPTPRPSRRISQPGDLEARQAADPGNQTGFYVDSQGRQTPNSIAPGDADDYHSQFGG